MTVSIHDKEKRLGWLLVVVQLACIIVLVGYPPRLPHQALPWCLLGVGIVLVLWAVGSMSRYSWSVHPQPRPHGALSRYGPYRLIRHPMYTGVLLGGVAQALTHHYLLQWIALTVLLLVFLKKMQLEEKYLRAIYPEYQSYTAVTYRLLPFLY